MRVEGLEPPCLAAPDPKSGTSTNSATPASEVRRTSASVETPVLLQRTRKFAAGVFGRSFRGKALPPSLFPDTDNSWQIFCNFKKFAHKKMPSPKAFAPSKRTAKVHCFDRKQITRPAEKTVNKAQTCLAAGKFALNL